jgi:uncharacterized protein (TIGR03435 family)
MVGLPDWARREYYDVKTTSSLTNATAEDRAAMIRAMLADRCKLVVHFEQREHDAYELVLARKDGKLGSGLTKSDTDCSQPASAQTARNDLNAPPTPCMLRTWRGATQTRERAWRLARRRCAHRAPLPMPFGPCFWTARGR